MVCGICFALVQPCTLASRHTLRQPGRVPGNYALTCIEERESQPLPGGEWTVGSGQWTVDGKQWAKKESWAFWSHALHCPLSTVHCPPPPGRRGSVSSTGVARRRPEAGHGLTAHHRPAAAAPAPPSSPPLRGGRKSVSERRATWWPGKGHACRRLAGVSLRTCVAPRRPIASARLHKASTPNGRRADL